MTPTQIQEITQRHLEAWFANPGGDTLRGHFADAINEALAEDAKEWQAGNATLRHERDTAQGALRAIRAAVNGDLQPDVDTETLVRQLYHESVKLATAHDELQQEWALLTAEVAELRSRLEKCQHDLVGANFAAEGALAKVKAARPEEP